MKNEEPLTSVPLSIVVGLAIVTVLVVDIIYHIDWNSVF